MPKVSVVLPVFNAAPYLNQCIDSILGQTLEDLELVIVDDGSADESAEIAKSYLDKDCRVRFLQNQENMGLISILNKAPEICQGDYIARMDADDWSVPERLLLQCNYLDANPHIDVVGSWIALFGSRNEVWHYRAQNDFIKALLLFKNNGMPNNSIVVRRPLLERFKYDSSYIHVEDAEFWTRVMIEMPEVRYANIPRVLTHYRIHNSQVSETHKHIQQFQYQRIVRRLVEYLVGPVTEEEWLCHWALIEDTALDLVVIARWTNKLITAYQEKIGNGDYAIEEKWLNLCVKRNRLADVRRLVNMPQNFFFIKEREVDIHE
ncbi:glycosyltransferase family 2 protein [Pokkaliibacter sp. MBI-7]|uniref:glycosyltransferase family 2 protein n=1 Tax=Pokkaliibacter sp. MBI-7 TaxID=3040600 RepID=UPI00244AD1BF|nr:glycosyltransferase family 2 protein [Pokkaliibacter sp. MBI-7]MDH2431294.1 glycosyltransferase family 2 protein [Pokkaliibacter sp. MBI-7]